MGKISRFGLMELSRQRLRPALNEGTHITCPRCNGTGVIRDVESSALHVLRVIQEEAMKENTATVHAQVPVDVATYLLNEKRAEIAKMEARLKVEIVLIPNKHIETPHYRLDRLRHDDERLNNYRASYVIAEGPADDSSYLDSKFAPAKQRQEAVVKGITPSQPAPVATQATAAEAERQHVPEAAAAALAPRAVAAGAPSNEGFIGRLLRLFPQARRERSPAAAQPAATAAPPALAAPQAGQPAGEPAAGARRGREDGRGGRDAGRGRDGRLMPRAAVEMVGRRAKSAAAMAAPARSAPAVVVATSAKAGPRRPKGTSANQRRWRSAAGARGPRTAARARGGVDRNRLNASRQVPKQHRAPKAHAGTASSDAAVAARLEGSEAPALPLAPRRLRGATGEGQWPRRRQ